MAYTPPTYAPSGSIFGTTAATTPYTYGSLAPTTSAYNIWGSTGNPYITAGPTYTPGSGAPIVPRPVYTPSPYYGGSGDSGSGGGEPEDSSPRDPNAGWWAGKAWGEGEGPYGPLGYTSLGVLGKLSAGINPTPWGNDYFDYYSGPGTGTTDSAGLSAGEQRDMLIDQEIGMWDTPQEEFAWHSTDETGNGYSDLGYSDTSTAEGTEAGDYAEAGFSQEDMDFATSFDDDSGGGDSGGGGGGSYIATAATNALGEGGLKLFEDWRDYMFTALPTFTTSYGRYRVTAPKIVSAIDKKENSTELYQDIWNEYLKPIFNLIKKDMDNPKALSDYKVMVKELMNKYLKGDK